MLEEISSILFSNKRVHILSSFGIPYIGIASQVSLEIPKLSPKPSMDLMPSALKHARRWLDSGYIFENIGV